MAVGVVGVSVGPYLGHLHKSNYEQIYIDFECTDFDSFCDERKIFFKFCGLIYLPQQCIGKLEYKSRWDRHSEIADRVKWQSRKVENQFPELGQRMVCPNTV